MGHIHGSCNCEINIEVSAVKGLPVVRSVEVQIKWIHVQSIGCMKGTIYLEKKKHKSLGTSCSLHPILRGDGD